MRALAVIIFVLFIRCNAEYRRFDGPITAASNYVHYSEGYVVTPGYVDISHLWFKTADAGYPSTYSSEERDWDDDADGNRRLDEVADRSSFVDVVLIHEPSACSNTRLGCDWTELGIGANDGVGNLRWCCSDDAPSLGLCTGGPKQEGRLIVDPEKFSGQHRFLGVPPSGDWQRNIKTGFLELTNEEETGKYVLVIANCNDVTGRNLTVSGEYVFKSDHGYLPGNLFHEMYFFSALVIIYTILIAWYGLKMSINRDDMIPLQKWVVATIGMGLLEVFFKAGDLWVWNTDGSRFGFTLYTGVVAGVLKRSISRCVVLMLCLGWGVTCDTLENLKRIVILGIAYASTSAARDVMTVFAVTENEILTLDEEEELVDVVTVLAFVTSCIDVAFYLWIFDALNHTMSYLEGMNQSIKLQRYLRLRLILLLSVLFAVVWSVFGLVDSYNDQRMVNEESNGWVLTAVWEVNYLLLLIGLSCLWSPQRGAKEYAYVMELTNLGEDLEFDTAIDSPEDDDDNVDNKGEEVHSGFKDDENLDVDKGVDA